MRVGSLCTGIRGLDLAAERHFGAEIAWHSEIEPAVAQWLNDHWPAVPNLGDLKLIEWAEVPPVDLLTAGYPCQPFSGAGKRKGADDPRHLWPYIAEAVRVLRPRVVVLENVAGHLSLGFGTVLGDLAEAGYDAEWCLLRASDVGAPHGRLRLFIVATDAEAAGQGDAGGLHVGGVQAHALNGAGDRAATGRGPAPDAGGERHGGGQDGRVVGRLDPGAEGEARERQRAWPELGDRGAAPPTDSDDLGPAAPSDATGQRRPGGIEPREDVERDGLQPALMGAGTDSRHPDPAWGQYEPAIRRWEARLGRAAPRPTDEEGRLSPAFVEWMMGYPAGWVDGLTRTQALKALGNAVVPQQALAALNELAPHLSERAA